jgi:hypothetical protein
VRGVAQSLYKHRHRRRAIDVPSVKCRVVRSATQSSGLNCQPAVGASRLRSTLAALSPFMIGVNRSTNRAESPLHALRITDWGGRRFDRSVPSPSAP